MRVFLLICSEDAMGNFHISTLSHSHIKKANLAQLVEQQFRKL